MLIPKELATGFGALTVGALFTISCGIADDREATVRQHLTQAVSPANRLVQSHSRP